MTLPENGMGEDWLERKAQRKEHYERFVKGRKLIICSACSGSGRYDHNNFPKCSCCNGTGKVREISGERNGS